MNTPKKAIHVQTRKAAVKIATYNGSAWFYIESERAVVFVARPPGPLLCSISMFDEKEVDDYCSGRIGPGKPIDNALPLSE